MYVKEPGKVIDLTPCLRRRAALYAPLALWAQYLSLAVLVLYGLLRLVICPGTPLLGYGHAPVNRRAAPWKWRGTLSMPLSPLPPLQTHGTGGGPGWDGS